MGQERGELMLIFRSVYLSREGSGEVVSIKTKLLAIYPTEVYAGNHIAKIEGVQAGLQQKYPISAIGLFGSFAREEATESSDIDIAET